MLLGIDWAIDMNGVINLKKSLCVVIPLDHAEGSRYIELVCDYESDDDLDYIYKIIARKQVWVNPIVDGQLAWERESSCTSDSDEETE